MEFRFFSELADGDLFKKKYVQDTKQHAERSF
jgi:hypothetical protein